MSNDGFVLALSLRNKAWWLPYYLIRASLVSQRAKNLPVMQDTRIRSLGWEIPLEKEMATHSILLAWRIPWTGEETGGSMGSQSVGHYSVTNTFTFIV